MKQGPYKTVPLADLIEDSANARLHGPENIAAIRGSLRQFGQVEPLVVQTSTRKIIGGNGRYKSMVLEGWTEAEIREVDCDNATAAAMAITLNRTAELATWDSAALDKLLREIDTGNAELQAMVAGLRVETPPEAPGDFPEVDEDIPIEHICPRCSYRFSGGTTSREAVEQ